MKKTIRNLMIASSVVALGAVIVKKAVGSNIRKEQKKDIELEKEEYSSWEDIQKDSNYILLKEKK